MKDIQKIFQDYEKRLLENQNRTDIFVKNICALIDDNIQQIREVKTLLDDISR